MLTVVENTNNSQTIALSSEEMKKLGLIEGDEVELSKNENNEIVLRLKSSPRLRQILETTKEIIERRRSALIELGKGHE